MRTASKLPDMQTCGDCGIWEQRLRRANDRYMSLILRQDRMIRDGEAEASAFEDVIQEGTKWAIFCGTGPFGPSSNP
jgi:hypothetical protein